jgi:hypothetical protein
MLYFIVVSLFCWYRVWFCEASQLPMIGTHWRGVIGVTIRWRFSASRFSRVLFHKTLTVSQRVATSSSYIAVSLWISSLSSIMMLLSLIGIEFGVVRLPNLSTWHTLRLSLVSRSDWFCFGFSFQFVPVHKTQTVAMTSYITVSPWTMALLPVMKMKHCCPKFGFFSY